MANIIPITSNTHNIRSSGQRHPRHETSMDNRDTRASTTRANSSIHHNNSSSSSTPTIHNHNRTNNVAPRRTASGEAGQWMTGTLSVEHRAPFDLFRAGSVSVDRCPHQEQEADGMCHYPTTMLEMVQVRLVHHQECSNPVHRCHGKEVSLRLSEDHGVVRSMPGAGTSEQATRTCRPVGVEGHRQGNSTVMIWRAATLRRGHTHVI